MTQTIPVTVLEVDSKTFDITNFKSKIGQSSYHRPSYFQMYITIPPGLYESVVDKSGNNISFTNAPEQLTFDIERVTMPGISIATEDIRRQGIGNIDRMPYVTEVEQFDAIVRSDGAGFNYSFFQSWIKLIVNYDTNTGDFNTGSGLGSNGLNTPYEVNYRNEYATTAGITAFNEDGGIAIQMGMNRCFPVYLGEMVYDWSTTNAIVKFPVKFTFSNWYTSKTLSTATSTTTTTTSTPTQYTTPPSST